MKLAYGKPNFYFLCRYEEKDIAKNAGFWWSPEGEEPLQDRGIWWTEGSTTAAKLVRYATPKAKAQIRSVEAERKRIRALPVNLKVSAKKPEKVRRKRKSVVGRGFDALCREEGIPVRKDFRSDAKYQQARQAVAAIKGESK